MKPSLSKSKETCSILKLGFKSHPEPVVISVNVPLPLFFINECPPSSVELAPTKASIQPSLLKSFHAEDHDWLGFAIPAATETSVKVPLPLF
ncbi:hypothetical protein D3C85_1497160 [compost metagenome]